MERTEKLKVFSRNTKKGVDQYKEIVAKAKTGVNRKVMKITDEAGNSIVCTPDHQIYTKNRGYVLAENLLPTDVLQSLK